MPHFVYPLTSLDTGVDIFKIKIYSYIAFANNINILRIQDLKHMYSVKGFLMLFLVK